MIQLIDSALNRITMYRLALYYVAGLLLVPLHSDYDSLTMSG